MGIGGGRGIYGGRAPEIGPVTKQRNRPPRAGCIRSENSERGRWLQRGVSPRSAGGRHITRSGLYGCSIAPHSLWKQADGEGPRGPSAVARAAGKLCEHAARFAGLDEGLAVDYRAVRAGRRFPDPDNRWFAPRRRASTAQRGNNAATSDRTNCDAQARP